MYCICVPHPAVHAAAHVRPVDESVAGVDAPAARAVLLAVHPGRARGPQRGGGQRAVPGAGAGQHGVRAVLGSVVCFCDLIAGRLVSVVRAGRACVGLRCGAARAVL